MQLLIKNVSKTYSNNVEALKNISLDIGNGMFGLLGPNGAGKSTLMRTIAGLQELDKGSVTVGSIDVAKDTCSKKLSSVSNSFIAFKSSFKFSSLFSFSKSFLFFSIAE